LNKAVKQQRHSQQLKATAQLPPQVAASDGRRCSEFEIELRDHE